MAKEAFRWEPHLLEKMTTEEIVKKFKELVPSFELSSFAAVTEKYLSAEDLSEAEYYPRASFCDEDEDFIWMACEELWKRLNPKRPAVEHIAQRLDHAFDALLKAQEERRWKEALRQSQEAIELLFQYTVEQTEAGPRVRRELFDRLAQTTYNDLLEMLEEFLGTLFGHEEYQKVLDIAGLFGEAASDDGLLTYKADALFALGRSDEGERLCQELIARNPDDFWYLLHAGDCHIKYTRKEHSKAKDYYLRALSVAQARKGSAEGREKLSEVYLRLAELAYETGEHEEARGYLRLLDLLVTGKVGRNDPCPCGSGKKYKKCCGLKEDKRTKLPRFDRRLMERELLALGRHLEGKEFGSAEEMDKYIREMNQRGELPKWIPETPLEQAQELVFQALETEGTRRLRLIEEALKVSPDCADAYVLLAEERAESLEEAAALYQAGMEAGERALGKEAFQEEEGRFWGLVQTRPYMRARAGLAQCLWLLGKRKEAIEHYRELLRLNPNDNQGIRYLLAAALLELKDFASLEELLGKYDGDDAAWLYTKALLAYIKQGDSAEARQQLKEALDYNPHVVPYLLGEKRLPKELPERIEFGGKSEAIDYAASFGPGWDGIEGALGWLASAAGRAGVRLQRGRKAVGIPEVFLKAFESEQRKGRKRQSKDGQES